MDSALFDYHLPRERIAQEPPPRRDASRLMVVDRATGTVDHRQFAELGALLPPRTRLFRNTAAVLKARLFARRATGGNVECLLLHPADGDPLTWWCLLRPGAKTLKAGAFSVPGEFAAEVLAAGDEGAYRVRFRPERAESVTELAERLGHAPLPPYIERTPDDPRAQLDRERYETVYADSAQRVAAAAPTAGLHFTPAILRELADAGHRFHDLTLRVGLDTFQPIQTDTVEAHRIHREWYALPADALAALETAPEGPRLAVGTTSLRAIEDAARKLAADPAKGRTPDGGFEAEADLFIRPPATFAVTDHLLTNFHLPRSTLLCLVSAFLTPGSEDGIAWLKKLYAEAIERKYRFYSYGDAMLIL